MDASRSEAQRSRSAPRRPGEGGRPGWWQALGNLERFERLAALGALVCAGATVLPWYRAPLEGLVKTGLGSFGFATAALMITAAAALALLLEVGRGRRPPLPLHEGTLLSLAGLWAGLIVVVLAFDRPEFAVGSFEQDYTLAYGIFVALGGAVLLTLAGARIRRDEIARERRRAA